MLEDDFFLYKYYRMYDYIYTMLNSRFTCPKVRAIKQEKVIKLIRQHRIDVELRMNEIRQQEKEMMKQLIDIVIGDKIDDYFEERADRIHG